MREIKFRAWGPEYEFDAEDPARMFHGIESTYDTGPWSSFGSFLRRDDMAIMQYTGLKDRNGTEIYEGDILRSYNSLGEPFLEVTPVEWSEGIAGWINVIPAESHMDEVIGNIYENPELLT